MMIGMSPRLASVNSANIANGPNGGASTEDHMNSSCKDTMKMNDRREFSFFESVNREFGNANAGIYQGSLGHLRPSGNFESISIGHINDTVSRLHGLNTSEMQRQGGAIYG